MLFLFHIRREGLGWSTLTAEGRQEALLCAVVMPSSSAGLGYCWLTQLQHETLGREGISLRQKCADLRLSLPPSVNSVLESVK